MELFMIGDNDYTQYITVPSYKVNYAPVYNTWTDANYITHRDTLRYKVSGSFKMLFNTEEELNQFLDDIYNNEDASGGYIPIKVYVNNLSNQQDIDAYISFTLANDKPYYGVKEHEGFEVKVEER